MRRSLLLAPPLILLLVAGPSVPAASVEGSASQWQAPVAAPVRVVRPFAAPPEPWSPGHRGVDVASPVGAPIRAASDGVVSFAGPVAGRGVVSVDHAPLGQPGLFGLRTTYEPVAALVRPGDLVRRGEIIGQLESGGSHCLDACLHWGLRDLTAERDAVADGSPYAGSPVYRDPMALLTRARIRLLPRWDRAPTDLGRVDAAGTAGVVGPVGPNASDPEPPALSESSTPPASEGTGASAQGTGLPPGSVALTGLVAAVGGAMAMRRRLPPG